MTPAAKVAAPLRQHVIRAALAAGAVEIVTRALTILLSIGTARMLEPQQVGLLGLAVIVVGALSLIAACAETASVTSRFRASDTQYAWTAVVIRGVVTACLLAMAVFAFPAVAHHLAGTDSASAELTTLVHLLLWQMVIDVVATYPRVLLQRRLRLTRLSGASLLQIVIQVVLSLALLWGGYGAAGVAWATLVGGGLSTAFLWFDLPDWEQTPSGSMPGIGVWRQVSLSTVKIFGASFVGYLNGRFSNLLVAGVLGPAAMSFYGMAWSLSRLPIWILTQALSPVLLPTLAHLRGDTGRMERVARESLRHSYLIFVPAGALLFFAADSLVTPILGVKWQPLVPALRVMSMTVLMGPLVIVTNGLLVATERAHLAGLATGAQFVIQAVMVVPLARHWGIVGAAVGDLASVTVLTAVLAVLCRTAMPHTNLAAGSSSAVPVLAASTAGLVTSGVCSGLPVGLIRLAFETGGLLAGYVGIVWLLGGRGRLAELFVLVQVVTRRPAAPVAAPVDSGVGGD